MENTPIGITPHFPTYEQVKLLLPIFNELAVNEIKDLIRTISEQTGTPQNPVDWTEPESWIPERLSGRNAELAKTIWDKSQNKVNPRHLRGIYWLIFRHQLAVDENGTFSITPKGRSFIDNNHLVIKEIDDIEGVSYLLSQLAAKTRAQRKDVLSEWANFLRKNTNYTSMSSFKSTLWQRLRNLTDRSLIIREGSYYVITKKGLDYVKESVDADPYKKVYQAISLFNEKQKEKLRTLLEQMDPYRFEHLVRDLLEAMGYEDVTVTSQSGDKGVDVVASIQFGITNITEVVQVKRHKGVIGRSTIDQLRGALPYHKAIRGTMMTLSDFSRGCKDAAIFPGAAPITLINGKKIVELLFEHEIGITKQAVNLFEVDEDFFSEQADEDDISSKIDNEE